MSELNVGNGNGNNANSNGNGNNANGNGNNANANNGSANNNGNGANNVNAINASANANGNNNNNNQGNGNNNRNNVNSSDEDAIVYKVVVNHEEQYSIWPNERANALGWFDVGVSGSKKECLDHIEKVWVDMRPLSLRKHMEQARARAAV